MRNARGVVRSHHLGSVTHRQIGPCMPSASQSQLRAGQPAHAGTGGSRHATVFAPLPQDKIARETEEFLGTSRAVTRLHFPLYWTQPDTLQK